VLPTCGEPKAAVRSVSLRIDSQDLGSCAAASTGPASGLYVAGAVGDALCAGDVAAVCCVAPGEHALSTPNSPVAAAAAALLMAHTVAARHRARQPLGRRVWRAAAKSRRGGGSGSIMGQWAMTL
jgi:hypothetical protein